MWFNQGRNDGNCFEEERQEFVVVCVGIDMPISLIDPFSLLHLVKYRVTQPDLNHPDFYLWGYLKDNVYENNPQTIGELKAAITAKIREIP